MTIHIIFYGPYSIFSRQFGLPKPCILVVYILVAQKYRDFKKKKKKKIQILGADSVPRLENMTRISWMANNAMPGSIIMNRTCWSLVPPVEPKVCSIEVMLALTSKNTLRILNTIKPVTRAFTVMDMATPVVNIPSPQTAVGNSNVVAPSGPSQTARGDKLKPTCQMKIIVG